MKSNILSDIIAFVESALGLEYSNSKNSIQDYIFGDNAALKMNYLPF
jgi:hypothetical protein